MYPFWSEWWFWLILAVAAVMIYLVVERTRQKAPATPLEDGESVIKQFLGGRRLAEYEKDGSFLSAGSVSTGRWYVTNRRLIYEGKIQRPDLKRALALGPAWNKTEPEVLAFPVEKISKFELVDEGTLRGRYVKATFKDADKEHHVQIVLRSIEEFVQTVRNLINPLQTPQLA